MIVADASVLTDFLLGRPAALDAIERASVGREHEPLHLTDLAEAEVLNALRGLVRGQRVTDERASEAVGDLGRVRAVRHPSMPLRTRVWELRRNLTAYDATYLALTEALGDAVLLTADPGLHAAAVRSLGRARVPIVGAA